MRIKGVQTLVIRQSYLEGMLPYEYAVILSALANLNIPSLRVFFEASVVSYDSQLEN